MKASYSTLVFFSFLLLKGTVNGAQETKIVKKGESELVERAWENDIEGVKSLLEQKADINEISWDNSTAVIAAIENDNVELLKFLIEKNADVSTPDEDGETPIFYAAKYKKTRAVELLVKVE